MRAPKERFDFVHQFLKRMFIEDLHAKRVLSLANGTLGVMTGAALAVSLIGQALAQARGLFAKSAIKQVDRLLSNAGVVPWDLFASWVREVVGERREIVVAMDWTDFDADNQSTLALHLVTRHGRATPLLWLTVDKDELKNQRNDFEDLCLSRLKAFLPEDVVVTILADRGFGDVKLFEFLDSLRFRYVIRFRGDIHVSAADGETRLAADWVGKGGRARRLRDAEVTAARQKVGAVVCVKAVGMKEAWHLAASDGSLSAPQIIKALFQKVDHRAQLPRQQGPALRNGHERAEDRRSATPRPPPAPQRLRHPPADDLGRRRREPRHGPPTANQHRQTPRPFPVPARLPALRTHPQYARSTPAAAHRTLSRNPTSKSHLLQALRHRVKMRGCLRVFTGQNAMVEHLR